MTVDRSNLPSSSRERQLDEILAKLMRALDEEGAVDRDAWLVQHPEFVTELKGFFAKHERLEKLVRPLRRAAANVLHVRCPHCHNPIELLDQAPLSDISCPSCGSNFSLIADNTLLHEPRTKSLGQFELLDRVGVGQFGSVWKARDTKLDRTVAIKIPRNGRMDTAQTEMFLRDARATAQLKHPNIVSVHEIGKQDDTVYIVSDFIQGSTLKEWAAAKRLTPREAGELCVKVAEALHHAHEAGVIHRDLKPSNIMLEVKSPEPRVKSQTDTSTPALHPGLPTIDFPEPHIVDFGLAKRDAGEITMTVEGQVLGTPAYMSPEQARGDGFKADRRTDIYSLGVILFELLSGELPFRGEQRMLLLQIMSDEPPSPRKLDGTIPRDLEIICLKCLEKEPHKRYATALHLGDDLRRFLSGESILARRARYVERAWKWARRRPALAALIVVCVLASLLIVNGLIVGNVLIVRALDDRTTALRQLNAEQAATKRALGDILESNERAVSAVFEARVAQARASRRSGQPGQRMESLTAIAEAASLIPTLKLGEQEKLLLRNEAIAAMALTDVRAPKPWSVQPPEQTAFAFDCELKKYAVIGPDGIASIRDVVDGKEHLRVTGIHPKSQMCLSRDGRYLSIRTRSVAIWDALTKQRTLVVGNVQSGDGSSLAHQLDFNPDASKAAVGRSDGTVAIYDLATAQLEHEFNTLSHPQFVHYHPGGDILAVASHDSSVVEIWNIAHEPQLSRRITHANPVWVMTWVGDGSALATVARSAGSVQVQIWETSTGHRRGTFLTPSAWSIGSDAQGDFIFTNGLDNVLRLWDAHSAQPILAVPSVGSEGILGRYSVAPSVAVVRKNLQIAFLEFVRPDVFREVPAHVSNTEVTGFRKADDWIISWSRHDGFAMWDRELNQRLAFVKLRNCNGAILHPAGDRVVTSGGTQVLSWTVRQSKDHGVPEIGPPHVLYSLENSLVGRSAMDAAGETLIFVVAPEQIVALDLRTDPPREIFSGKHPGVEKLAITPDGRWVASAPWNAHGIHIWNLAERRHELLLPGTEKLHRRRAIVVFSPDSRWLVTGVPGQYRLWSVGAWDEAWAIPVSNPGSQLSPAAFSPDGKLLALCPDRSLVRLIDPTHGAEIATLIGPHRINVASLTFHPDGGQLYVGREDGSIQVWNLRLIRERLSEMNLDWNSPRWPGQLLDQG